MDRYTQELDVAGDSPPSEARLFAQAILGRPILRIVPPAARARDCRAELERLAPLSDRHAQELCDWQAAEAEARRDRELLEWAAGISTRADEQLRALQRKEADEREACHRAEQFHESYSASLTEWNEADHPRAPKGTPLFDDWYGTTVAPPHFGQRAVVPAEASVSNLVLHSWQFIEIGIYEVPYCRG